MTRVSNCNSLLTASNLQDCAVHSRIRRKERILTRWLPGPHPGFEPAPSTISTPVPGDEFARSFQGQLLASRFLARAAWPHIYPIYPALLAHEMCALLEPCQHATATNPWQCTQSGADFNQTFRTAAQPGMHISSLSRNHQKALGSASLQASPGVQMPMAMVNTNSSIVHWQATSASESRMEP